MSECPAGVEPAFPAWKADAWAARPRAHVADTSAEGEGVEPSRLIARRFSGPLPSPIGLPFPSVWMAGFEPALSGSRSRRIEPSSPRIDAASKKWFAKTESRRVGHFIGQLAAFFREASREDSCN